MDHVWFSAGFFIVHLGAYVIAGVLHQQLARYARWEWMFGKVRSETIVRRRLSGGFAGWLLSRVP